jgi:putative tricarboxylic transport membrane protein
VCGLVIAAAGALKARARAGGPEPVRPSAGGAVKGGLVRPLLVCAIVVFFGLTLDPLGFHIAATITVAAAALVFGAGPLGGFTLGIAAAFAAHFVFYSFLRVPLPWGVLTPVAW